MAPTPWDLVVTAALLAAVTATGTLLQGWGVAQYNIIMLYMVGVLLTALCTKGYVCGVLGSVLSVALFNFFFTTPELTFHAYDSGYQVTFGLMLTTAVVVSTLTTRLKTHAKLSARAAWRTNLLFDTSQLLQKGQSEAEILSLTARQLVKLLDRQVAAFPAQEGELGPGQSFGAQPGQPPFDGSAGRARCCGVGLCPPQTGRSLYWQRPGSKGNVPGAAYGYGGRVRCSGCGPDQRPAGSL